MPVDWRLMERLAGYGPRGIWPGVPELAASLGVSPRTVQRSLQRLHAAGMAEPVPTFEHPDDANWTQRGRRISHLGRQTTNTYRVTGPVTRDASLTSETSPAQTPVTRETNQDGPVKARVTPRTRVSRKQGECSNQERPDSREPAATYRLARGRLVDLERASLADFHRAVDQLDRDTCSDGSRCQPGQTCRRHTWKRRRRPA